MARTKPTSDRSAKLASLQKQARTTERRRLATVWVVLGVVLVLIVGAVTFAILSRPTLDDVQAYEDLGREHVTTPVTYEQTPPVGGDHHPTWWDCGVYTEEVPPHHAVHSLEHGAVWLSYQPDLPEDQVATLREMAGQEFMLLSPVADQESPVMASAWGVQIAVDTADDPRLPRFIREYRQGPQTPEPGAACTGGTTVDLATGR